MSKPTLSVPPKAIFTNDDDTHNSLEGQRIEQTAL